MHRGRALIIATSQYDRDPELQPLPSVAEDAAGLQDVLADPHIGNFRVTSCLESDSQSCRDCIAELFDGARGELLLLYVSGHGVKDGGGELYLAVRNTLTKRLGATGIPASFIKEEAKRSRARGIVTILDTCFSGAYTGLDPKAAQVGVVDHFPASPGRAVITATDAIQHAFGAPAILGQRSEPSAFSSHVIRGLKTGAADLDGDGQISSQDLYDYVVAQLLKEGSGQSPQRWLGGAEIHFASSPVSRAAALPPHIIKLVKDGDVELRLMAVEKLKSLLIDADVSQALRLAARQALEELKGEDDSLRVRGGATAALQRADEQAPPWGGVAVPRPMPPARSMANEAPHPLRRAWRAGDIIQDNGGPVMIVVPRGVFQLGSPENEKGRFSDEGPAHEVRIDYDLAVGQFPVTRGEWRTYAQETGRTTTSGGNWLGPGFSQDDSHPVVCMSWEEAQAYIAWLSQKTGQRYRMLSEAEHEYVNRAGTRTRYFWGESVRDLALHANNNGKGTTPVGSLRSNAWGLHDTTGNVFSWTQDAWHSNYEGAPADGSAWEAAGVAARVVRGGSWTGNTRFLRSAYRGFLELGSWSVGLRLARTP